MEHIRKARPQDAARIAEIEVFNYRLNFYPIFRSDWFYFDELTVPKKTEEYSGAEGMWVYDDGVVKGFVKVSGENIDKLFVEPVLQGSGIGAQLLEYASDELHARTLWALEKNTRAIAFYQRHGFVLTGEKIPEDDTDEYLVRMARQGKVAV